jgi:hypothetical protein
MSRKYEAIDLLKLRTHGSTKGWNDFLNECLVKLDIHALAKVRYRICAGMDDLAKAHLNTEEICVWFVRLNRSLEVTAKKIIRIKHPMPGDKGTKVKEMVSESYAAKKKRDFELQKFMKESAY